MKLSVFSLWLITASVANARSIGIRVTNDSTVYEGAVSIQDYQKIYGDDHHLVYYRRPMPLDTPRARIPVSFPAGMTILKNGTIRREGAKALSCDIVQERDVPVELRDGTIIYTNIHRPVGNGSYPVIFSWSPYGKEFGGQWLDDVANRSGVPVWEVSELMRFEGADPAYWVNHGYVVLSPDPRGVGRSEGNIHYWGRQMAEDGYDLIEWAAKQTWSSGKVGMTGNSFLAVSQWFIAAGQPPSLAAIAPWEGFSDHFRDIGNPGGIPDTAFAEQILQTFSGTNLLEDQPLMIIKEQFRTPYWQDKQANLKNIITPAYVVASYTNTGHTHGTFAGYRGISSPEKWLRVHNTQEWEDYYTPAHMEDLRKFFDHYLKSVSNGWKDTPKVRLSVLDPGGVDIVNRTEKEFPLARTKYTPLFLTNNATESSNGTLEVVQSANDSSISYEVTGNNSITFTKLFDQDTEVTGYMSLRMWVEAVGSTDMEIAVSVQKLDKFGKPFADNPMQTITANGRLRVSRRKLDRRLSTPSEPLLLGLDEQLLSPGEVVQVDINIWPMGMIYHKGETMELTISEKNTALALPDLGYGVPAITAPADGGTYEPGTNVSTITLGGNATLPTFVVEQQTATIESRNKGSHVFHLGGKYKSRLLIPVIDGSV